MTQDEEIMRAAYQQFLDVMAERGVPTASLFTFDYFRAGWLAGQFRIAAEAKGEAINPTKSPQA